MQKYIKFNPTAPIANIKTLASLATLATAEEYSQKYKSAMVKINSEFNSDLESLLKQGLCKDAAISQAYNNARPKLAQLVPSEGTPIDICQHCKDNILQGNKIAYVDGYSFHYHQCFNDYEKEKYNG